MAPKRAGTTDSFVAPKKLKKSNGDDSNNNNDNNDNNNNDGNNNNNSNDKPALIDTEEFISAGKIKSASEWKWEPCKQFVQLSHKDNLGLSLVQNLLPSEKTFLALQTFTPALHGRYQKSNGGSWD
jgi:hypothetical protein